MADKRVLVPALIIIDRQLLKVFKTAIGVLFVRSGLPKTNFVRVDAAFPHLISTSKYYIVLVRDLN